MLRAEQVTWVALAAALLSYSAHGQGLGNSPYSRLGLGETTGNVGGVRQLGMGGTGLAAPNSSNVNELNPALLYFTPRTTWEAAFNAQVKDVRNANGSYRTGTGTLAYLVMAVPLSKRWGAAIGLKPYSSVNYESSSTGTATGDPTAATFGQTKGTGGISEAYIGTGFHVLRDLTLGGSASYLFGTVEQTAATSVVTNATDAQRVVVDDEALRYSDFLFRASAHYRHKLGKDLSVNLAGVQTFQANVHTNRVNTNQFQDVNGALIGTPITLSDESGNTLLPALSQVGISLDNNRNWTANLDGSWQQWSKFQTYSQLPTNALSDSWRVAAGGEYAPDPGSVDSYFKRVSYRLGVSLSQMPYQPAGIKLYDRAVHWGFSFPLPTASALESTVISLAFIYGVRGNTNYLVGNTGGSNVRENYLRVQAAATLSNRWFIKRRLQ